MKATLEFELPEERTEFELASRASYWRELAWEMQEEFRRLEDRDDVDQKTVQRIKDFFYATANDMLLDMD